MTLKQRSIRSSAYNIVASIIQTIIQLARSILLARLLAPEDFGIYTFAVSIVIISKSFPLFGMGEALIHRANESEGTSALEVHFTLTFMFSLLWAFFIFIIGNIFIDPGNRWVFRVILFTQVIDNISQTGIKLLTKKVLFKRIALIGILITVFSTISSIWLAWNGYGLWSLVSTDLIACALPIIGFYVIKPEWKPKFGWSTDIVRYFLDFGRRSFLANILKEILDNIDDLWTGTILGNSQLGYYSRAYTFATYPRRVLAFPLNNVVLATYAELKGQRKRLSQAFFRANSIMIRTGFLFSGLLALIAPEFIRILLGVKWLPMLTAFRLMLIYTLLDPIQVTIANIFIAVGEPGKIVRVRMVQLAFLIVGLITLGNLLDIAGVALSVDFMLVLGIALLLFQAREYVDYSLRNLFGIPTFALVVGMIISRGAILIPGILGSPWRSGTIKFISFVIIYLSLLIIFERSELFYVFDTIKSAYSKSKGALKILPTENNSSE